MISKQVMEWCLPRIRLMTHFPGSDMDLLIALGQELSELCPDDEAAKQVVSTLIEYREWPGIYELRRVAKKQRFDREDALLVRQAKAARDEHEKTCKGFTIVVDDENKTVAVRGCYQKFGGSQASGPYDLFEDREIRCRKSGPIDWRQLERDEALKRGPGWESESDRRSRESAKASAIATERIMREYHRNALGPQLAQERTSRH
jgi:hypothetical protein